jgi:hypothetical protein
VHKSRCLQCPSCKQSIGVPMMYRRQGENRPAFKMLQNRFHI